MFNSEFIHVKCLFSDGEIDIMGNPFCLRYYKLPDQCHRFRSYCVRYGDRYIFNRCDNFKVDWITFILYREHLILKGE